MIGSPGRDNPDGFLPGATNDAFGAILRVPPSSLQWPVRADKPTLNAQWDSTVSKLDRISRGHSVLRKLLLQVLGDELCDDGGGNRFVAYRPEDGVADLQQDHDFLILRGHNEIDQGTNARVLLEMIQ